MYRRRGGGERGAAVVPGAVGLIRALQPGARTVARVVDCFAEWRASARHDREADRDRGGAVDSAAVCQVRCGTGCTQARQAAADGNYRVQAIAAQPADGDWRAGRVWRVAAHARAG